MIVLPNMGLIKWDQIDDTFSHQQLAANFTLLDSHDHTAGKGKQIPAGGLAPLSVGASNLQDGAFTSEKIANGAITNGLLADLSVTTGKIADGTVTNTKLASPTSSTYKRLLASSVTLNAATTANTYIVGPDVANPISGTTDISAKGLPGVYLTSAAYAVPNLTQKLEAVVTILTNATAPAINFTPALYPVTVAGGSNQIVATLGTKVTGSNTTFTTPAASSITVQSPASDFSAPVDGFYVFGVVTSGTLATNAVVIVHCELLTRNT